MRIFVTGAAGFAGQHLCRELSNAGHEVIATDQQIGTSLSGPELCKSLDITDAAAVSALIAETKPDACIHLAAISFVPDGASNPELMTTVNVNGTMNLLAALKKHSPDCRMLLVSTSQVYGMGTRTEPITEDSPLSPQTAYAKSKVIAENEALEYAKKYGMAIIIARPGNHTGPGQRSCFVVASFIQQIKTIARGDADSTIQVGNMESQRGFTDVRDVVRAYRLLLDQGCIGKTYNISAGNIRPIGQVLDEICDLAGVKVIPEVDETLYRPTDAAPLLDSSRIREQTGWTAEIPFIQTIKDMLDSD
jgi:GDP-4-dehydro-6-deoxy-D-mannose reductase